MVARPYLVAPIDPLAGEDRRVRPLHDADLDRLPSLLLEAYQGTVDDHGETLEDVRGQLADILAGRSGTVLRDACAVVDGFDGEPVCAVVTTRWWGIPFLCFVVTAAGRRGEGLATAAIRVAAAALRATGETELGLIVTAGNPAARLYARLGFVDRERPSGAPTEAIFSFGTLRQPEVRLGLFGRTMATEPDLLPGFGVGELEIQDPEVIRLSGSSRHPALERTDDPEDVVDGAVLLVTTAELAAADEYERVSYERESAVLASGREAWIYVPRPGAG